MHEKVGKCTCCGKEIDCLDGFLNGVHSNDKKLYCFDCVNKQKEE